MATDWQSRRDGFDHRRDKPLDRPINWKYWGSLPALKQWDACALSVNVNPENLKKRRMVMPGMPVFLPESFPNRAVELEFQRRLTMFGRFIGGRPLATVSPAQFAAWCLGVGLENLPPELVAMATPEPKAAPVATPEPTAAPVVSGNESKVQRQDRRLMMCESAGLVMPISSAGRLPDGVGDIADREGVTRQAFSSDVKAALKRRESAKREGQVVRQR